MKKANKKSIKIILLFFFFLNLLLMAKYFQTFKEIVIKKKNFLNYQTKRLKNFLAINKNLKLNKSKQKIYML